MEKTAKSPHDTADLGEYRESILKFLAYKCNNALQYAFSTSHKEIKCYYDLKFYFLLIDKTPKFLACDIIFISAFQVGTCSAQTPHLENK